MSVRGVGDRKPRLRLLVPAEKVSPQLRLRAIQVEQCEPSLIGEFFTLGGRLAA